LNKADRTTAQDLQTSPGPSGGSPNTCRGPLAQAAGGTLSGPLPLVDTQELRPSYSPNGSQPFETIVSIDPLTGEVLEFEQSGKPGILTPKYTQIDHQNTRAERWAMKWALDALLPGSRQFKCHRWRIPGKDLEVKLSLEHKKAFYAGFECCGSVWGCPLCAPKITERRRVEVNEAIEQAKELGLQVMLATFTVPHGMGDSPLSIRKQMMEAWRRGSTSRAGKQMRKMIGLKGYIRAVEVTFGENGFHPHMHVLLFLETTWSPEVIRRFWYPIWLDGCRKSGLDDPSEAYGVRVDDGTHAANYVSKWGMDSELTKGHLKKGKKSVNPWDLLRVFTFGVEGICSELREVVEALGIDKKRAGALFLTFFKAFKGSRQLYWSNGLRALLGLDKEKSDQELAEEEMDTAAALLATLSEEERFDLIRTRNLPTLLSLAEDSPGLIPDFLQSLRRPASPEPHQGEGEPGTPPRRKSG
jgi:Replication protein